MNLSDDMDINKLSERVIGCAIEVHRTLGPGLLESAYEQCIAKEFQLAGIHFNRQATIPVNYKDLRLDCGYRIDFLVEDIILLELKSVEKISDIHKAQLLTYMKLTAAKLGLLINFNVKLLKEGLHRFIV